jgi:probable rRNA maturation factor
MAKVQTIEVAVNVQDYASEIKTGSTGVVSPILSTVWQGWVQAWLELLVESLPPAPNYELTLRLTRNDEMRSLNAQYREKDHPTDVLAFAALETDYPQIVEIEEFEPLYLGDIVISVEMADTQAQERGHSLEEELAWLGAHGLLHLLGWDHPDEESLSVMLHQQEALLQIVGMTVSYD